MKYIYQALSSNCLISLIPTILSKTSIFISQSHSLILPFIISIHLPNRPAIEYKDFRSSNALASEFSCAGSTLNVVSP